MKHNLIINKLSGHDSVAKVGKVSKKIGDSLKSGDIIFVMESAKGTLQYKSEFDGILENFYIDEGDTIKKNQTIGIVEGELIEPNKNNEAKKEPTKDIKKTFSFGIPKTQKKVYNTDIAIIGGGPGGYVAAIRAAQNGKKVVIIEEDRLGGTCLNYGCIPTKTLVSSVEVLEKVKTAEEFGIEAKFTSVSLEKMMKRKESVVNNLVSGIENLMTKNSIEYIKGKAEVIDENKVIVKNKQLDIEINFKNLIIATGAKSLNIPIEGADDKDILTSKELLELTEIPESLTIVGGGIIGMEFAFIYNALGTKVNVMECFPKVLTAMDDDVSDIIRDNAREKGINLYEGYCLNSIKTSLDGVKILEISKDNKTELIITQKLAMAVGRKANLESIDLKKLSVELNERKNGIMIDEYMRTSNKNIYAIGDVTNKIQLAHLASHQGIIAADHIVGKENKINYDLVPSAVFTVPEVGCIGITEKKAIEDNIDFVIGKFPLIANGKAQSMGETDGFVKLISDKKTNKIIGGTIVGAHATDMIATITNMIYSSMTLEEAEHVIYAHPTIAESIHEAVLDSSNRGIHF